MKKLLALMLLAPSLGFAAQNGGVCTRTVTVATSATTVIPAEDVTGGRHYLELQNTGAFPMFCAIGADATTSNGFRLAAQGGGYHFASVEGVNGVFYLLPADKLSCIADGGPTTAVYCDF
jgi:hypothetical protein